MPVPDATPLGAFLRARRARLDPAEFGFDTARRRTPGLRREEVALRAHISVTWYTWLEQGRGGAPSSEVLGRIAAALVLAPAEREHLFLLAHGRPHGTPRPEPGRVTPRLRRVLDALDPCPAFVKTATWDVVAWNRAAAVVLTDYGALAPRDRNILRLLFRDPTARVGVGDWERHARLAVETFRLETARAGAGGAAQALVDELSRSSPTFAAMWADHDVRSYGEGTKHFDRSPAGPVTLEYSSLAVDDRPDLGLIVYTPATPDDRARVRALVEG